MVSVQHGRVGINPRYGTPGNPYDRRLIPGGSSSGAAVSVSDGGAVVAIGTDTGGSVRIPAALCGVVGFKPTQNRIPRDGVTPLSTKLDSVGPLANSVACCAVADAVMAGEPPIAPPPIPAENAVIGSVPAASLAIPATPHASLMARLDRLGPATTAKSLCPYRAGILHWARDDVIIAQPWPAVAGIAIRGCRSHTRAAAVMDFGPRIASAHWRAVGSLPELF